METLPNSVSNLKLSSLPPPTSTPNREFHRFTRTPHPIPNRPPKPKPQKIINFLHNNHSLPFSTSTTPSVILKQSSPIFHHKPATGYAAAIIDVAQTSNTLHAVQRDVHRLLKFLRKSKLESDGGIIDASAVRKVVEQGNFERHVVGLVKMLMKKKKLGMVGQVLEEFERIYDELCGTQIVLVSSKREIGKDEMFGIAKSVHKLSGAVRVRVRNFVQD
ncbi:ATP synthase delta chain, chloroplastic-like [Vicia villosa]|uniref:ATP synthase delta chain, chloroplastic-like n=1 Tax=Vicia villosa TaxID=3911 RepID=UPI00273B36F3|nr:ATP synthase delta chain, chloroplastic-like [Vicia villosa]